MKACECCSYEVEARKPVKIDGEHIHLCESCERKLL